MILVLVPLVGIVLGVALYAVLRAAGALDVPGAESAPRGLREPRSYRPSRDWSSGPLSLRDRIENVPRGCLIAIIVATAIWIVAWLIVLLVGLSLLS